MTEKKIKEFKIFSCPLIPHDGDSFVAFSENYEPVAIMCPYLMTDTNEQGNCSIIKNKHDEPDKSCRYSYWIYL